MKMNDNVRTWLRDLRSGEYEQGTGRLVASERHYCCLGVACVHAITPNPFWDEHTTLILSEYSQLSMEARDVETLVSLNDDYGFSFSEIADIVEQAAIGGCSVHYICLKLHGFAFSGVADIVEQAAIAQEHQS